MALLRFLLTLFLLGILTGPPTALAEGRDTSAFEITTLQFVGNTAFEEEDLELTIITRQTPGFLAKFFYSVFGEKLGRKPSYFDHDLFVADVERLRLFYNDNGYIEVGIRDSLVIDSARLCVDVFILISENRVSRFEKIDYVGLDDVPAEVRTALFKEPTITIGMPYQKTRLNREIDRVLRFLGNEGYPDVRFDREKSSAGRFLSSNNFRVVLTFVAGKRMTFGEVNVVVNPPRADLTTDIVRSQLEFEEGKIFSKEALILSERNLNRLGVFDNARIGSSTDARADTTGVVPILVEVRPRDRHELSPEISFSDENNAFNLSLGIGYTNRNFFGGARNFTTRMRLRAQSIQEWNFSEIFGGGGLRDPSLLGGAEVSFQLAQPYLFTRSLSGTWAFSLSVDKQSLYLMPIIRNKIGLSNQFALYTVGFLDWSLERVSAEFLKDTSDARIAVIRRREEERPQFNSILTATLQRDKTNDIFSPTDGFFHSGTIEESGVLPLLLRKLQPDLPFTQFYKVTLLGKWYKDLTRTKYNIFALKLRSGYQDKYGGSKHDPSIRIPLNRRFFAGGSGSIRGWRPRDLGAMPENELELGGNFIFEGSSELRINYFRGFGKLWFLDLDNFWFVYFLDIGNVWTDVVDARPKDVAIALGIGLRYETLFGPVRIDFGFRIYDPKEQTHRQWVFQKRLFGDVIGDGVLHFGVGHAF